AAVAAHFGRELSAALQRVEAIIGAARQAGAALLVLPDGTLGRYLDHSPTDAAGRATGRHPDP
ncbi:MAG TPA: hypothetical protein VHH34_24025, partial [Pseudonocardiaceae bacterium]|nr:hypothetical protein [Pseudonocardiaceae bacterium]